MFKVLVFLHQNSTTAEELASGKCLPKANAMSFPIQTVLAVLFHFKRLSRRLKAQLEQRGGYQHGRRWVPTPPFSQ